MKWKIALIPLLVLLISSAYAGVEFGYGGNGVNDSIYLVAEDGFGNNWSTAISFQDIVDHFEDNPIPPLFRPSNQDATEKSGWAWYAGPLTTLTQNCDSGTCTAEDTSGFSGNDIHPIDELYPTYMNCTSVNSTTFSGCTAYKYWGSYGGTLGYFDSGDRVMEATNDSLILNTTDYVNGSYSLQYNSTHDRVVFKANIKDVDTYSDKSLRLQCYWLENFRVWVKAEEGVVLDTVEIREVYSSNGREFYYGDIWTLNNDTIDDGQWNLIDINLREYGMSSKRAGRDWLDNIDTVIVTFSNATGKRVQIDSPHCYIENPNPREIVPNVLFFPVRIYQYEKNYDYDLYLEDYGKTIIVNHPHRDFISIKESNVDTYVKWGYSGETTAGGGSTNKNPQSLNLIWNTWCDGYNSIRFESTKSYPRRLHVYWDGVMISSTHPSLDGMDYIFYRVNTTDSYIRNSVFTEVGDWFTNSIENTNVQVKGHRYTPWGSGGTFDDVKIWLNQNYAWIDTGTVRSTWLVSARLNNRWLYSRDYSSTANRTVLLYDWRLPSGFFDSSNSVHWRAYSKFTSNCLRLGIGNTLTLKVTDNAGNPIENAEVTLTDTYGSTVFTNMTNSTGDIEKQDILYRWYDGGCSGDNYKYMKNPDKMFSPFNLTIAKTGYKTYSVIENFNQTDSTQGYRWTIALQAPAEIKYDYVSVFFGMVMFFLFALSIYFVYLSRLYSDEHQVTKGLLHLVALTAAGFAIAMMGYGVREYIKISGVTEMMDFFFSLLIIVIFVIFIYNLVLIIVHILQGYKK